MPESHQTKSLFLVFSEETSWGIIVCHRTICVTNRKSQSCLICPKIPTADQKEDWLLGNTWQYQLQLVCKLASCGSSRKRTLTGANSSGCVDTLREYPVGCGWINTLVQVTLNDLNWTMLDVRGKKGEESHEDISQLWRRGNYQLRGCSHITSAKIGGS